MEGFVLARKPIIRIIILLASHIRPVCGLLIITLKYKIIVAAHQHSHIPWLTHMIVQDVA